jgi:histidinol phosphatase-like PHP family hydrolase
VLTEHAPQLYVPPDDFWHARHIRQPALWRKGGGRMDQFRRLTAPLRGPRVRVGLEVELDADGHLTLRDEDRDVADVLVGAVHWLAGPGESAGRSEAEVMDEFLKTTEALCRAGIDILAHPWRSYMKRGIRPRQHYRHVAAILRETGVAAEINQHLQPSDPEFFAACIEAGVKIALGSDAHEPAAAAALSSHLAIVREIAGDRPLDQVLWQPGQNIR